MAPVLSSSFFFGIRAALALCVACCVTGVAMLFFLVHDPLVLKSLERTICQHASNAFECTFTARVDRIDMLSGALVLTDVMVVPCTNRDWFWTSDTIALQVDWVTFFREKKILLTISCGWMNIQTQCFEGKLSIAEHIDAFTRENSMAIPIIPEKLRIPQATITVHGHDPTPFECQVTGSIERIGTHQHTGFTITQERAVYKNYDLARSTRLFFKKVTDISTNQSVYDMHGTVQLRNPGNLDDTPWIPGKLAVHGTSATGKVSWVSDHQKLQAILTYDGVLPIPYHLDVTTPAAVLTVDTDLNGHAACTIRDHHTESPSPLAFTIDYFLKSDHALVHLNNDAQQRLSLQLWYDGRYTLQGSIDFFKGALHNQLLPPAYRPITSWYDHFLTYHSVQPAFSAQGTFIKKSWRHAFDISALMVRIPFTYNFLRSVHTTVRVEPQAHEVHTLFLEKSVITTDRGTIMSGMGTLICDASWTVQHAHLPVILQDFFINKGKDFFAELSAACVIEYNKQGRSKLSGRAPIKKCHIRNNPFSGNVGNDIVAATINPFEGNLLAQTTDLDLIVHSYEPVEITTAFLQARAHVNVQLLGTVYEPQLYGTIEILEGALNFPYAQAQILYGKIFFVDNQRDDPAIELCATAFIKNYSITLLVDGTARNPTIKLQSTPTLHEEQIVGLLVGGAPDSGLALVMPLSALGVIEKLLFGSDDEYAEIDQPKGWLDRLQQVKIVPRFSDQTSRGGLRAALAIEVNDTISALIQQNFSLSEDTLIEVAYKPTDELTVRAIRDERGDFGGEVEARFTW